MFMTGILATFFLSGFSDIYIYIYIYIYTTYKESSTVQLCIDSLE